MGGGGAGHFFSFKSKLKKSEELRLHKTGIMSCNTDVQYAWPLPLTQGRCVIK